ncbi:hypothetical protein ACIPTP_05135 [Pectobacterium versatile]|uniref:hypothetical protein n=1 Tax=Pectobacterium versatile TaxID=2488639 RepID=UPI0038156362
MINFDSLFGQLPELPSYKAQWVPVYLEPMMASGERITIAVAALGQDGFALVRAALRPEKAKAMYAEKSDPFMDLIKTAIESLQFHLDTKQSFEGWLRPFSGLELGEPRSALSSDIIGILRQAVSMSASLSALDFDAPIYKDNYKNDSWANKFKETVVASSPGLEKYFRGKFTTGYSSRDLRVFFLSPNIAVNTGKLIPGASISYNFDINKSRLLDLLTVKENEGSIAARSHHELIVYRPANDDASYSKIQIKAIDAYVNALNDAGDKHEIRVTTAVSPETASKRLLSLELGS